MLTSPAEAPLRATAERSSDRWWLWGRSREGDEAAFLVEDSERACAFWKEDGWAEECLEAEAARVTVPSEAAACEGGCPRTDAQVFESLTKEFDWVEPASWEANRDCDFS